MIDEQVFTSLGRATLKQCNAGTTFVTKEREGTRSVYTKRAGLQAVLIGHIRNGRYAPTDSMKGTSLNDAWAESSVEVLAWNDSMDV